MDHMPPFERMLGADVPRVSTWSSATKVGNSKSVTLRLASRMGSEDVPFAELRKIAQTGSSEPFVATCLYPIRDTAASQLSTEIVYPIMGRRVFRKHNPPVES